MSAFTSLAGIAAMQATARQAAAQAPGDLGWLDEFKGRHKQVYDLGGVDLTDPLPPLRFPRNYLNSIRDVLRLEFPEDNTAVGISNTGLPMNVSDAVWQKYGLGERFGIIDPTTMQPAVRNVFLDGGEFSVRALLARGTVFWQCQYALKFVALGRADATARPLDEGRADLIAGLTPGARLVPSHMLALGLAQERGFTYVRT
jgi:hypothetical protein